MSRELKADDRTVMIAETISLGILSLPSVLATVGLVPGFLLIFGLGVIATYTGYVIGQFKQRYPWVCIDTCLLLLCICLCHHLGS